MHFKSRRQFKLRRISNYTITFKSPCGFICPDCHTLVTVPSAGMHDRTKQPFDTCISFWVGSSHISDPTADYARAEVVVKRIPNRGTIILTPEHDTTRPIISIPASASAVLAAIEPAATQPSTPSFSTMMRKISTVDFGRSSSRTEETIA